jgi:hypothetical protein
LVASIGTSTIALAWYISAHAELRQVGNQSSVVVVVMVVVSVVCCLGEF